MLDFLFDAASEHELHNSKRFFPAKSCLVLALQPNVRTEVTLPDTEISIGANLY